MVAGEIESPQLAIVIHTEEEFDWDGGFDANATDVTHGDALTIFIDDMTRVGAKTTLAMDYAFVTSQQGKKCIRQLINTSDYVDNIEFAAHLHPWVNPPFSEDYPSHVPETLSYPGNLPKQDEFLKLQTLTNAIKTETSSTPVTYLAGRYGIGVNTNEILAKLGYQVDISISPFADFSHQFGPDFSGFNNDITKENEIINWPHTSAVTSPFAPIRQYFNSSPVKYSNSSLFSRVIKKITRTKLLRLSPEGFSLSDMKNVTKYQYDLGQRCFILSFHSPSVKAGLTPYVRTQDEAIAFKEKTIAFLSWFKKEMNGEFIRVKDHTLVSKDEV